MWLAKKLTVDMFPLIQNVNINEIIPVIIQQHLLLFEEKILKHFPTLNIKNYNWIPNPFSGVNTSSYEFLLQEEEFVMLSTNCTFKMKFFK